MQHGDKPKHTVHFIPISTLHHISKPRKMSPFVNLTIQSFCHYSAATGNTQQCSCPQHHSRPGTCPAFTNSQRHTHSSITSPSTTIVPFVALSSVGFLRAVSSASASASRFCNLSNSSWISQPQKFITPASSSYATLINQEQPYVT